MSKWKVGYVISFADRPSISDMTIVEGGIDKAIDVALLASRFPVCNNPETVCMSIWKMKEGEKK